MNDDKANSSRSPQRRPARNVGLVSVIVPTFNSERYLSHCLDSIKTQSYRNVEIVVVDNHSKDGTKKVAENYGARFIDVSAKRSKARNMGANVAKGNCFLFVDSDMLLNFTVISECAKKIVEGCNGVIIPELSVGKGFWAKCKALEKACYISDDSMEAARFFEKTVFEDLGGYDVQLEAGEDWDLHRRACQAGYRIGRIREFIKHHEGELGLRDTILKKYYYGKTVRSYMAKHPEAARRQLTLIRPAFVKNWKKLAKDPIHAVGMLFMKNCEFVAAGISIAIWRKNC